MFFSKSVLAVCIGLSVAGSAPATADEATLAEAFDLLTKFRSNEAFQIVAGSPAGDRRSQRLAGALALLTRQPFTTGNLAASREEFRRLAEENGDDEIGIASRFFEARVLQRHLTPPDRPAARRLYRQLFADHPAHVLAQYGLVKVVTMDLYVPEESLPPKERFARLEPLAVHFTHAGPARSFHQVMGQAGMMFGLGYDRALPHHEAAVALGFRKDNLHADVLIRAAECARLSGQPDKARRYYSQYLEEFPRYSGAALARRVLEALAQ